ncbi:hypothetical protein [Nocardioides ungokensis]|uniref:hypothetical protein n=1 Tax=Nocardioides ungokensis TaxID=1643322 RepID=UPI0015DFD026|nr:hypothetical protein [Nocardioides ungokensis]
MTGSVTNEDKGDWTSVYMFAFMGDTPIRSTAELAEASTVDPTAEVGGRITSPGTYDTIDRIAPGETVQYAITVPHSEIHVSEAGVYWFGVHALGTGPDGRLDGADGGPAPSCAGSRRRTRPWTPPWCSRCGAPPPTPRTGASRTSRGGTPPSRRRPAAPDGRLRGRRRQPARSPGCSTPGCPTWSGRSRSATRRGPWPRPRPGRPAATTAAAAARARRRRRAPRRRPAARTGPTPATPTRRPSPRSQRRATPGSTAARGTQRRGDLALPYGDLDVAAAAEHDPALYRRARQRSGTELAPWGLPMTPAVSAPGGYLDAPALRATPARSRVLVTDRMYATKPRRSPASPAHD